MQDRGQRSISPLELGLVELPTRPRSEYTVSMRRAALEAADNGRLREAADLTRAAMTESGYARGVLGSLVYGLWGLPLNFIGHPEMVAALCDSPERQGQFRQLFPQPDAIRLMSWGITLGVGIGQMRRRYAAPGDEPTSLDDIAAPRIVRPVGAPDIRELRTWDPKYLRYQWWDDSWWLMTADGEIRITPNDGEWILYMPYGPIKPWEYGAWKALTLAFILGRDSLFDRSRHAEVLAPIRVGKVPQGTTERQRKEFQKLIREMQRMGTLILPPGLDYAVVESTHKIGDIYDKIIDWAQREVALIYTGNETTTTGSKGFSGGDVQERIARYTLASFASSLSSCLHDGGLRPWASDNYGADEAPRPEFDCDPPEDKKAKAETASAAGKALVDIANGLKESGLRMTAASATKFVQTYGIEVEAIPHAETAPPIDLAPTDLAMCFRVDEARRSRGWPIIGDARGDLTIAEMKAQAAGETAGPAPDAPAPVDNVDEEPAEPPTDESAANLASKMTTHALERCEHGACNRCRKCGIERHRDFIMDPKSGEPRWVKAWKPLARLANGHAARPLFAMVEAS